MIKKTTTTLNVFPRNIILHIKEEAPLLILLSTAHFGCKSNTLPVLKSRAERLVRQAAAGGSGWRWHAVLTLLQCIKASSIFFCSHFGCSRVLLDLYFHYWEVWNIMVSWPLAVVLSKITRRRTVKTSVSDLWWSGPELQGLRSIEESLMRMSVWDEDICGFNWSGLFLRFALILRLHNNVVRICTHFWVYINHW